LGDIIFRDIAVARLLWELFLFGLLHSIASAEDNPAIREISDYFGNFPISCKSMVVVEYVNSDSIWDGEAKIIPFDLKLCEKLLYPTDATKIIEPVVRYLSTADLGSVPNNLSPQEIEQNQKRDANDMKQLVLKLHLNAQNLAETCRQIVAKPIGKKQIACYFGAPQETSRLEFKSLFQAMLKNSFPANEAVCTAEPISTSNATTPFFRTFLKDETQKKSWAEMKNALQQDHFFCASENCLRSVIAIFPVDGKLPKFKISKEALNFAIIVRQLSLYRGEWHGIWPYAPCEKNKNCSEPSNGVSNGICTQTDSSEGSAMMAYMLNGFEE
jgi:hypothetical protein